MKATIDKELLPMKAHYFLFNAGKYPFPLPSKTIKLSTAHRLHQPIMFSRFQRHARAAGYMYMSVCMYIHMYIHLAVNCELLICSFDFVTGHLCINEHIEHHVRR